MKNILPLFMAGTAIIQPAIIKKIVSAPYISSATPNGAQQLTTLEAATLIQKNLVNILLIDFATGNCG